MSFPVLIVEDSDAKMESIRIVLERELANSSISYAYSVKSGIDLLKNSAPSLIIADMSLPTYDIERRERGGTPRPFGGIEMFEHLDRYDLKIPVIVVTAYPLHGDGLNALNLEQLRSRLAKEFPDNYSGLVYFDSAYSSWESDLLRLLEKVVEKDDN